MTSHSSPEAPRISVVMSACNAGPWLAEAVQSVLDQSFTDFEFLAHDDGSTDNTLAILQEFAARDARMIVTSGPNQGVGVVPNLLIAKARGEFIARMDADDISLPDRFERQVAFFDAHPDHVLISGWTLAMDGDGRIIGPNKVPTTHEDIDARHMKGLLVLPQPCAMMRRSAVDAAGGYDPALRNAEDLDLWLRMAEAGRIANIPHVLLKYRMHDKSLSAQTQTEQADLCRQVVEAAWTRRGVTASFDYKDWRMTEDRASRRDFYLKYGWDAWNWGYRDTWRHYALKAVTTDPLSLKAWKLLVFGAIRRPPPGKYVLEDH